MPTGFGFRQPERWGVRQGLLRKFRRIKRLVRCPRNGQGDQKRLGPACFNLRAQAFTVAPVVITSSTSSTMCPRSKVPRTSTAPRTFARRALGESPVWGGVKRVRRSESLSIGIPVRSVNPRAKISAWLNPLSRLRLRCSGTGTMRVDFNNSSSWVRVSISFSPNRRPKRSCRWNFTSRITCRMTPSYNPKDRAFRKKNVSRRQRPQRGFEAVSGIEEGKGRPQSTHAGPS